MGELRLIHMSQHSRVGGKARVSYYVLCFDVASESTDARLAPFYWNKCDVDLYFLKDAGIFLSND